MALVVLGSRRVTRDFDFVIAHPGDRLASTIDLFYDRGLELVARLNDVGEVTSTFSYFNASWGTLGLLVISGNFWNMLR